MAELDSILSGRGAAASDAGKVEEPKVIEQAQAESVTEETETTQTGDGGQKMVPHEALHAEKQKVKRYTEQVAEFERKQTERDAAWERRLEQILGAVKLPQQEQPKAPDFWEAPDAFTDSRISAALTPVQQQLQQTREYYSKALAIQAHGKETVDAAEAAVSAALAALPPEARAEMEAKRAQSHDPYGEIVGWHKKRAAAAEIGDDPAAFRERVRAEILAEVQGDPAARTQTPAAQTTVMPSNLAGARNVGSRSGPAWSGPQSLNDIFKR